FVRPAANCGCVNGGRSRRIDGDGRDLSAKPDGTEVGDAEPGHQPYGDITRCVAPEDVSFSIAVEISSADDGPAHPDVCDGTALCDADSVHQPHCDFPGNRTPQDVGFSIAVEVTRTGDGPAGPDVCDGTEAGDAEPVHQPYGDTC